MDHLSPEDFKKLRQILSTLLKVNSYDSLRHFLRESDLEELIVVTSEHDVAEDRWKANINRLEAHYIDGKKNALAAFLEKLCESDISPSDKKSLGYFVRVLVPDNQETAYEADANSEETPLRDISSLTPIELIQHYVDQSTVDSVRAEIKDRLRGIDVQQLAEAYSAITDVDGRAFIQDFYFKWHNRLVPISTQIQIAVQNLMKQTRNKESEDIKLLLFVLQMVLFAPDKTGLYERVVSAFEVENVEVDFVAIQALASFEYGQAFPLLKRFTQNAPYMIKRKAILVLGEFRNSEGAQDEIMKLLVSLLEASDNIDSVAAESFAQFGESARKYLEPLMKHPEGRVRTLVAQTLKRLGTKKGEK